MLVKVARWVRYWFGLQPLVAASSMYFICSNTWKLYQEYGPNDPLVVKGMWVALGLVLPLEIAIAAVSARAWFTLRRGRPSARGWAIAASLVSLPVPVFGTIAGILGLVAFTRRDVVEKMAIPVGSSRMSEAGDIRKDFFISYNKADKAWAEWIGFQLEKAGYSVLYRHGTSGPALICA